MVKALNHIGYHELEDRARPAGVPGRVLQPGGPVFGGVLTRPEFERDVRAGAGSLT